MELTNGNGSCTQSPAENESVRQNEIPRGVNLSWDWKKVSGCTPMLGKENVPVQ
jgi:hypothetical protein